MESNLLVAEFAHAKVNLSLSVTDIAPNGMHFLDFVGKQIDLHDDVTLRARNDDRITIKYSDGQSYQKDNAVLSARKVMEKYGTKGVDIEVVKRIPEGGGFGGSTADGVAVIKGMQKLFGFEKPTADWLLTLGSDFPFMYQGGIARVRGLGEIVEPLPDAKVKGIAVHIKGLCVSTKEVFAGFDLHGGTSGSIDEFISSGYKNPFNSLEKSATAICPLIDNLGSLLRIYGYPNTMMTGSGSAYIGYFAEGEKINENIDKAAISAIGLDVYEIN